MTSNDLQNITQKTCMSNTNTTIKRCNMVFGTSKTSTTGSIYHIVFWPRRQIFGHCLLNPIMVYWTPLFLPNEGVPYTMGRGSTYIEQGIRYTMGREIKIPWYGVRYTMDRRCDISWVGVRYTMRRGFNMPWVGGQNTMGMRLDIPMVRDSTYHG
jgi:hypothetical protein